MNEALESLSETLDREHEMRKQFRGALMYPACVLAWVFIAVSFLLIAVVPRFSALFAARGGELPLPTRVLIAGSEFLAGWWFVILGVAAIAGWLVYWGWTTGRFKPHIDRFLHALPVVREILRGAAVARFAQVLGLSLRSGLGLIEALELAGRASARPLLIADANRMAEQVKHGGRLADVLIACRYLPPIARRMLTAGEEAAELPRMCAVISDHCEREVAHLARNVTDLIEPLLIVVLAALVLLVALAIFLPMWNMAALL